MNGDCIALPRRLTPCSSPSSAASPPAQADYDHDGRTDAAIYRPSTGTWYIRGSGALGQVAIEFGSERDIPIPVDLEGDGTADCAFYRPGTGVWYARPSSGAAPPGWQAEGGGVYTRAYGGVGGVKPVPADYDGDGQTDLGVYRPVTGTWFIDQSSVPVGDASRTLVVGWGAPEDRPTPADYDDDQSAGYTGRVDIAVYRPSTGTWYVRPWGAQAWSYVFGASGDQPLNRAALPTAAVTMTSPFPGTVLPASSPVVLTADVSVSHGAVVRVEFRVDGQTVGTVTTAPYSWNWTGGQAGAHEVVAVVVDSGGVRTFSAPVSVSITSGATGQLGAPIITPGGGAFHTPPLVALQAATGATVRYTLDGSDPTEASALYTAPVLVGSDARLRARAFQAGWTPSPVSEAVFTIDPVAPLISATVEPAASAHGWHYTAPTVSFTCADDRSGVAACPAPVTLTTEGANQVVTGTATDGAGNTASVSVTLSLDRTAPEVAVTDPAAESVVSGASVEVTATVSDAGSGVVGATCNGRAATLTEGTVTCTVPIAPGRNDLVVQAVDAAGHSGSAGVRIRVTGEPTSLVVAPSQVAMVVGATRAFTAVDQHGVPVADAAWTVSDPVVAELDALSPGTIRALAVDQVTVTATHGLLTASTTVTVYPGPTLPMGTIQWAVPPVVATASQELVFTHQTEPEVPALFVQETSGGDPPMYRPVTEGVPGAPVVPPLDSGEVVETTIGETFGGLLLRVGDYRGSSALVRTGGPASAPPWRFTAVGLLGPVAQGPDGTVFVVETSPDGTVRDLLGVDGATGRVRFRERIPGAIASATYNIDCSVGLNSMSRQAPEVSAPIVGADGQAYAQVVASAETWDYLPCGTGSGSQSETLTVLRVSPTGSVSVVPVHEYSGPLSADGSRTDLWVGSLAASEDAVVATWEKTETGGSGPTTTARATVLGAGAPTTYELTAERGAPLLVGLDNRAFTVSAAGVVAYDVTTGVVSWTVPITGVPVLATEGGGVEVRASDGTLTPVDGTGDAETGAVLPLDNPVYGGAGTRHGEAAGVIVAMEGPRHGEAEYWFDPQPQRGNANRQAAPAITRWGLRLIGDPATRAHLLWFFQDALAQDSGVGPRPDGQSWLWADKQGFLRVLGDRIDEFKGLVATAQPPVIEIPPGDLPSLFPPPFPTGASIPNQIGDLVVREARQPVIEVALSAGCTFSEEHQHDHDCGGSGGYTFDRGVMEAPSGEGRYRRKGGYDTNGPQVILDPTRLSAWNADPIAMNAMKPKFAGQAATPSWIIRPFVFQPPFDPQVHAPVALWHELGHAWGVRRGGTISAGDTWREAVGWENLMRFTMYGRVFGLNNAPRIVH